jgi:hypothetical protein
MLFRSIYSGEQLSEVDETVQILLAAGMIRVLDGVEDCLASAPVGDSVVN